MSKTLTKDEKWEARKDVLLNKVMKEHGCGAFDVTGSLVKPPRWALVTESRRGNGKHINLVDSREAAEQEAGQNLHENFWPICIYDLDTLEGDAPLPYEVEYQGETWRIHDHDRTDGKPNGNWVLKKDPADKRRSTYDFATVDPADVEPYDIDDDRQPRCFDVAKVQVVVAFNTTAT